MKRGWILAAVLSACAPHTRTAGPPTVAIAAPSASAPESPKGNGVLDEILAQVAELSRAIERHGDREETLPKLAQLLQRLGFQFPENAMEAPAWNRAAAAQIVPVNLDRDEAVEYVVTLEARFDNPNAGSGDAEPSGYLYVAWLDAGPEGYRVVGRRAFDGAENAIFTVRFEPFHDPAFADTILSSDWSHTVNVATSATDLLVTTLERGKVETIAEERCGQVDLAGAPPRKIVCDRCVPIVYAEPPGAVPCADPSKPTLAWNAATFSYR